MVAKFEELAESLRRDHASNDSILKVFLSGTAVIDVRVGSETYVLAYYPSVSLDTIIGVEPRSRMKHTFNSFAEAEAWLRGLLRKA